MWKIIIFSSPYNKIYLEQVGAQEIEDFNILLDSITHTNGVRTYHFLDKYADLDIWADPSHVAYNNNKTTIYSEDIANIIQMEIEN